MSASDRESDQAENNKDTIDRKMGAAENNHLSRRNKKQEQKPWNDHPSSWPHQGENDGDQEGNGNKGMQDSARRPTSESYVVWLQRIIWLCREVRICVRRGFG